MFERFNDWHSTLGTRLLDFPFPPSAGDGSFHDHGPSPSVAFHSLPQPNPVPSPTVTYGRLPKAIEAKIALFQKLRFRSPEQNGVKRTKTELIVPGHFAFYTLHSALNDPCPPVRFAPSSPASTSIHKRLQAWFFPAVSSPQPSTPLSPSRDLSPPVCVGLRFPFSLHVSLWCFKCPHQHPQHLKNRIKNILYEPANESLSRPSPSNISITNFVKWGHLGTFETTSASCPPFQHSIGE